MTQRLTNAISRTELICLIAAVMALNSLAIDIMLPALPAMGAASSSPHGVIAALPSRYPNT
ncbi:exported hypothetical protein [Agrobacterium deltaense RV3]|nr:exported hypothetical protein [Agrobacterium deltaense RV3]